MFRLLVLLALFSIASGSAAVAADIPIPPLVKARPAAIQRPQSTNWSGVQIGASNGISSISNNFVEPGAYVCPSSFQFGIACAETPFSFAGHTSSYAIGPFVGYRWQLGRQVIGIEGDWEWKRGESNFIQLDPGVCFDGRSCFNYRSDMKAGSIKQTWDGSVRFRYGWLLSPSVLLYGTAGVAVGQISGAFNYSGITYTVSCVRARACVTAAGSTAAAAASWSDTRFGWTIGVGTEAEIAPRWTARIEYRFTDFGRYTKTVSVSTTCLANGCSAPSTAAAIDLRESFQTIRVGLAFNF